MPAPSAAKLLSNFWLRIDKTDSCWLWKGAHQPLGYGFIVRDGRRKLAHRVSYELANGPIPEGLEIDHLCRNPPCVNPDHLEAVTHRENMLRSHPGAFNAAKTHCPRGHEYTPNNTYTYENRRNCRTCVRERVRQLDRTYGRARRGR